MLTVIGDASIAGSQREPKRETGWQTGPVFLSYIRDYRMIIRTGLIKNRDDVPEDAFRRHWLNIHGPLALRVPGLRAYTQNHIVERHAATGSAALHRIDGLSQLWFDDIPAMVHAMASTEQQACVNDIRGFLSHVTIVVQQPGEIFNFGEPAAESIKLMLVLMGDLILSERYGDSLGQFLRKFAPGGVRFRVNKVIDRNHVVDPSIPRGHQVIAAISEIWFSKTEDLDRVLGGGLTDQTAHPFSPVGVFTVNEYCLR
jgi:uncharacterized protein (TIGR02118 family)